jgi:hypothetical protein
MFANLCFFLPEVISVNPNKPECNGSFLTYRVPNFDGAKVGTEFKGFYIMLGINKHFLEIDDLTNWFLPMLLECNISSFECLHFPYALWPWLKGNVGEEFTRIIQDQVPEPVQKVMNQAHSVFAPDSDMSQSLEMLSCRWKYSLLDFTGVKDIGELLSKVLFADAGDMEVLDYDVIEVPVSVDGKGAIMHLEYLLGFKVGCRDPDG